MTDRALPGLEPFHAPVCRRRRSARRPWWPLVILAAACARPARPVQAPEPAPAVADIPPGAAAPGDTAPATLARGDTTVLATTPDLTREAVELFGDSVVADSGAALTDTAVAWDMDVRSYETKARVAYYIRRFQGTGRERFAMWLARGGRYEPMIRAKLRQAGLPEDLTYLALIESGYDNGAYSRAAAVGMWQFMASTARSVGLRVDWWVDERRDPVRSTDGAVKFLGYLNEQFGSLFLAAAAYNGGPGRVSRGLSRYADDLEGTTGEDVFFALAEKDYLRQETKDYVPRLIAAALVAKQPERYGFDFTPEPPLSYDSVTVPGATPLAAVARAANAPVGTIRELNPALLRGLTPPGERYTVRVPSGSAVGFTARMDSLPAATRRAFTRVATRRGDTFWSVARRNNVSVEHLRIYNRALRPDRQGHLAAGRTVLVPSAAVLASSLDIPDPSIERYGSTVRGRTLTHVVRRGESLSVIAQRYHTTVAALRRLNGLRKSVIYAGQVIVVRGAGATPSSGARRAAASRGGARGRTHLVSRGETLTAIARRYDLTVAELKALNGLSTDAIRAGQRLTVGG